MNIFDYFLIETIFVLLNNTSLLKSLSSFKIPWTAETNQILKYFWIKLIKRNK